MSTFDIAVIVGSLRHNSFNHFLANALAQFAPSDLSLKQLRINDLPLYNQDDDAHPHQAVQDFKARIKAADGIIFVTPEYNRSIPGVLKNAIDHASRPYGASAWDSKPAGILGASIGVNGTAMAQQHLRNVLAYLNIPTLAQPEAFIRVKDDASTSADSIAQDNKELLQSWMNHYAAWIKKYKAQ